MLKKLNFISGETKKYSEVVFAITTEIISEIHKNKQTELGKTLRNTIFDLPGPRSLTPGKKTPNEDFTTKIFKPFSEILNSLEAIQNIPIYIRTFPYKNKTTKISYLKYHIENYLQELYILKERYIVYLTDIERIYKKTTLTEELNKTTAYLKKLVIGAFEGYSNVRGTHVHRSRFEDKDLERLSLLDSLARTADKNFANTMESLYKIAYRDVRKKWVKRISLDIKNIEILNNKYFGTLYKKLVINGKLAYPWNLRG